MGWFLIPGSAGKKKKRRSSKSKRSLLASNGWNPQNTLVTIKAVGAIAGLVLVVFGWTAAQKHLIEYAAAQQPEASPPTVALVDPPAWMSEAMTSEVQATVQAYLTPNAMDRDELEAALAALEDCGWIAQPTDDNAPPQPRLERKGQQVLLRAAYRTPVAAVMAPTLDDAKRMSVGKPLIRDRDVFHLVDRFGRRLPASYRGDIVRQLGLPLVVRVHEQPPPIGRRWLGDDLQGAVDLAQLISNDMYFQQVKAIDAYGRDSYGRVDLILRTRLDAPTGAVWGPPPGSERVSEPDANTKRTRLMAVLERRGQVDAGGKLVLVDGVGAAVPIEPANQ